MDEGIDAITLWEQGTAKERAGAMTDAIKYYRKALKIEPNVEKIYRKKLHEEWKLSEELKKLELSEGAENASANEQSEEIPQEEIDLPPCWILEMLSDEILLRIINEIVLSSAETWVNLSLTCKKFNALCFSDSTPYRTFARYIYSRQVYNEDEMRLNGISEVQTLADTIWGQNYKKMLTERPYIKFHGVYISVVNYLRHGSIPEGSSSLLNPIHMITYYRYLRFYPNGSCLRLLTTNDPSIVVPSFSIENQPDIKDADICTWSLSLDEGLGRLAIKRTRTKDELEFLEELQISNQGHRPFNKLKWINSSATKLDGTVMEFSLQKEKPFIFSRVKYYSTD